MTNNRPSMLLAKSIKVGREAVTLQAHLEDTEKAASEVFCLEKRWGRNWCRFFKISSKGEQAVFYLESPQKV